MVMALCHPDLYHTVMDLCHPDLDHTVTTLCYTVVLKLKITLFVSLTGRYGCMLMILLLLLYLMNVDPFTPKVKPWVNKCGCIFRVWMKTSCVTIQMKHVHLVRTVCFRQSCNVKFKIVSAVFNWALLEVKGLTLFCLGGGRKCQRWLQIYRT